MFPQENNDFEAMQREAENPISYDAYGRMRYNPEYHGNQKLPWSQEDEQYLIDNYEIDGPEAISLALERTIHTVMTRAHELRKKGKMPKSTKKTFHRRSRCEREMSNKV